MAPIASPENVLKRAEELVSMEKPAAALELLYDTILSKRTRNVSLTFLEPIVLRFVELSVDLRKGKIVKDGLHQYKKLVVPTNVPSLQVVVDKLLVLAEEKVTSAQEKADQITVDDEDLEAEQSPEDLLMATVSSELTKDRTDRELVTPWLKFLWEAYRSVLDVLRNSSKLEALYSSVVSQAFQFCLRYQRKTEFRRLCELLRNHLQMAGQQAKLPNQTNPIDLSDPDTLQLFLDTRFEQLGVAVKLELWQEAFRSVEDVHKLLTLSRRPIKLANMVSYYETLARIFAVGNNHLFHAAALAKYYSMVYHTRHSAPEGELERIASYFLLSVLCIPASQGEEAVESRSHRLNDLSALLSLSQVPTRESLMQSAMAKNVLQYVRPEIKQLYLVLETDFHPLLLKERLEPIFDVVGKLKAYQTYVQPLLKVVMARLFRQLSQVYTTTRLDHIVELATFAAPFNLSKYDIEQELVLTAHATNAYRVRIDHAQGSVTFLDSLATAPASNGPQGLEETPGELVAMQLRELAVTLTTVLPQVDPRVATAAERERAAVLSTAQRSLADENTAFLNRRQRQEERLLQAKKDQREREAAAAKERAARIVAEREAEERRVLQEAREREEERIRVERQAIQDEQKRAMAAEINARGIIKVDMEDLANLDTDALRRMQLEQLQRENEDIRSRMAAVARRRDHLERAYRKEEAALWIADGKEQESRDREAYEQRKQVLVESAKARAAQNALLKERYARMGPLFNRYIEELNQRRQADYVKQKAKNDELLAAAKAERREKVLKEREVAAARAKAEAEERERQAAEQAERDRKHAEEREKMAAERARREAEAPNRFVPSSLRRGTPESGSSPFGNARAGSPATGAASSPAPARSPFGAAKPVEVRSSPFGSAKPVEARSSPFGNARAGSPATGSPAAGSPAPAPAPARNSPFGSAKPVETRSPFGNARPSETGPNARNGNRPSGGAYRPPARRS